MEVVQSQRSNVKFSIRGSGPPVLLVHGIPTSRHLWDFIVPALEGTFTCIAVDVPGLGESSPLADGSLDPARQAQEFETLREQLSIMSWHVIGHDAGSTIAVHYAAQFSQRVERLILCSPPVFPEFKVPWFFRLVRIPLLGDCLAPFVLSLLWHGGIQSAIGRRDAALTQIVQTFRYPFRGYKGTRRFVHLLRWGDPVQVLGRTAALLPGITAPTLICHGQDDGAIPVDFAILASRMIPHAELRLMNCGHFLPLSCPDALSGYILPFLISQY
ncbi:MAG TPA: alpha/beta hydrolase [Ktedonobacteraceae bacterium]|nr:alpha/beta hydrolase [Ktedonobacteraceae bacterium]